jgi:hypothetical protein
MATGQDHADWQLTHALPADYLSRTNAPGETIDDENSFYVSMLRHPVDREIADFFRQNPGASWDEFALQVERAESLERLSPVLCSHGFAGILELFSRSLFLLAATLGWEKVRLPRFINMDQTVLPDAEIPGQLRGLLEAKLAGDIAIYATCRKKL